MTTAPPDLEQLGAQRVARRLERNRQPATAATPAPMDLMAQIGAVTGRRAAEERQRMADRRTLYGQIIRRAEQPNEGDAATMIDDLLPALALAPNDVRDDIRAILENDELEAERAESLLKLEHARAVARETSADVENFQRLEASRGRLSGGDQSNRDAAVARHEAATAAVSEPQERANQISARIRTIRASRPRLAWGA